MKRILTLMIRAAGRFAPELKRSLRISILSCLAQAAALALYLPILGELSRPAPAAARAWLWVGALGVLVVVEAALRRLEVRFAYDRYADCMAELRLRLGAKLRTMPREELSRRLSGDLTTVVGSDVVNAVTGLATIGSTFLQLVIVPVLLLVVVLAVDWRLGAVLALSIPFAAPIVRRYQQLLHTGFSSVARADADAASRIVELVQLLPVMKATRQVGARAQRLVGAIDLQGATMSAAQRSITLPAVAMASTAQVATLAMVTLGASLVIGREMPVTLLVGLVATATRFAEPIATAANLTAIFELMETALRRVDELLAVEPLPVAASPRAPERFDVELDHVTFAYAGHAEPDVREVSLHLPEKSMTALVGASGSGKTTLTRLMTRYADPQRGAIRIGGVDLREIDPDRLMGLFSIVFQEVYLFDDTIRANIRMGRPSATDADVEAAAREANAHDFICALPQGYSTRVGEIGNALSGGERQRISIARAILKDAPIVILDEPTAALDAESEVAVQAAIERLVREKTVLVIAHRLSTITAADQVVVLDAGRVVEQGPHERILARSGPYASLWATQGRARSWKLKDPTPESLRETCEASAALKRTWHA